jgi:diguanylate cyclase (GGDEF)-like protein
MPKIVVAGLDPWLRAHLDRRLSPKSIVKPADRDSAAEELVQDSCDLLILDHSFASDAPSLVEQFRQSLPDLPVIYCLDSDADGKLVRRLVLELKVNEILFHPVDPQALVQRAASLLNLGDSAIAVEIGTGPDAGDERINSKLAEVWRRSRSTMLERVDLLDTASIALADGRLEPALRLRAEAAAHKLAGSLGTFGLHSGSRFAREMEEFLRNDSMRDEAQGRRFSQLAAALRAEIERWSAHESPHGEGSRESARGPLLLVEGEADLAAQLVEQAAARGWRWESVTGVAAARSAMAGSNPVAVLVDTANADEAGETLSFLREISEQPSAPPLLILSAGGNLMDRVEVVRLGGRGFFPRGLPPGEIVEAALAALERATSSSARVLAVDDDPAVLEILARLVESTGIRFTGLGDPLRFWDELQGSPPDLLILDIEMPSVSGIELCRVMRNDPRWAATPVIFLTAHTEPGVVERVFDSGADDFVAKPIVGPELVARILNRLERTRLLRNAADLDPLSGLANRVKFRRAFGDLLRLADRHGQPVGLALLSADGLDRINEERGTAVGDELVRQLGSHLRHEFRSEEIAARRGGNEFCVGIYGLDRPGTLRRVQEVARGFEQRNFGGGPQDQFQVTLSGGVAVYPEDGSDLDGLLRAASEARLRACEAGGDRLLAGSSAPQTWDGVSLIDLALVTGDEATASVLRDTFESVGYSVRALRHGLAASRTLCGPRKTLRARVLLIDLELPFFDGLMLFRQLAAEDALEHSRAIALSSASMGRETALALELGAEDHVARPVDLPVLVERVRRALESPGSAFSAGERIPIPSEAVCTHASPARLS